MSDLRFTVRGEAINPVGLHLWHYMKNPQYRLIILYGGSSSGKSYGVAQMLLHMVAISGENAIVMRKVGASIEKSIYEDFKVAAEQIGAKSQFVFTDSLRRIRHKPTGARIDFAGIDDPEKIKGISNYRWVFMDEWSEFDEADFKQVRKRLRGKHGQQIVTAFNPIKETHWIKRNVIDTETWTDCPPDRVIGTDSPSPYLRVKSLRINSEKHLFNPRTGQIETHAPDTVLIQTTYLNNFWVVGSPKGTYGYYDEQCIADFEKDRLHDPDYYNVYALGEWGVIRTGSEFFSSFNRGQHCKAVAVDEGLPIHVSVDVNVLPYITITGWQIHYGDVTSVRQVFEICAGVPDNTIAKAAKLLAEKLKAMGRDSVTLHGDASTRSANAIDERNRSMHDLFISSLQEHGVDVTDKVGVKNPNVAMTGEFINAVFDGRLPHLQIVIDENCSTSIEDYLSVQKDENGAIFKRRVKDKATGQSYEEHGHCSDCLRYITHDLLNRDYIEYSNSRKRSTFNGALQYFNPETDITYTQHLVYAMPNVGGRFVMVHGGRIGERWHILDVAFTDTDSVEVIKDRLKAINSPDNVFECPPAYYPLVRELRSSTSLTIKVTKEHGDIDRRIAATSDYIKSSVLFRQTDDVEYTEFLDNLLDYSKDSRSKEASAVMSGFVMYAEKSFPSQNSA